MTNTRRGLNLFIWKLGAPFRLLLILVVTMKIQKHFDECVSPYEVNWREVRDRFRMIAELWSE